MSMPQPIAELSSIGERHQAPSPIAYHHAIGDKRQDASPIAHHQAIGAATASAASPFQQGAQVPIEKGRRLCPDISTSRYRRNMM